MVTGLKKTVFVLACVAAAYTPFMVSTPLVKDGIELPSFPETFEGRVLKKLELTAREKAFGKSFPGKIGRFTDGEREVIIRVVSKPTRRLHPASDCFRGIGYEIKPDKVKVDRGGRHWGCFTASKAGKHRLKVCEFIHDSEGRSWSDVSAWYWDASLDKSTGPWWTYTVATASL